MKHTCECVICGHIHERQVPSGHLVGPSVEKRKRALFARRFWSKVEKTKGCWLWKSKSMRTGYGMVKVGRKNVGAHRVAWELFYGPIPQGKHVLHKCDIRYCVNPHHLFIGTPQDNSVHAHLHGRMNYVTPFDANLARAFNRRTLWGKREVPDVGGAE